MLLRLYDFQKKKRSDCKILSLPATMVLTIATSLDFFSAWTPVVTPLRNVFQEGPKENVIGVRPI